MKTTFSSDKWVYGVLTIRRSGKAEHTQTVLTHRMTPSPRPSIPVSPTRAVPEPQVHGRTLPAGPHGDKLVQEAEAELRARLLCFRGAIPPVRQRLLALSFGPCILFFFAFGAGINRAYCVKKSGGITPGRRDTNEVIARSCGDQVHQPPIV